MHAYTPEDRRMVAEALMEARFERMASFEPQCVEDQERGLLTDIAICLPGDADVFEELSQLIDPTSEVAIMDEAGEAPWNDGGARLDSTTYGCHECGYPYGAYASFRFPDRPRWVPRFCPNCGARQVVHPEG